MQSVGKAHNEMIVWDLYWNTVTLAGYKHMTYNSDGEEVGVHVVDKAIVTEIIEDMEEKKMILNEQLYETAFRGLLAHLPNISNTRFLSK